MRSNNPNTSSPQRLWNRASTSAICLERIGTAAGRQACQHRKSTSLQKLVDSANRSPQTLHAVVGYFRRSRNL